MDGVQYYSGAINLGGITVNANNFTAVYIGYFVPKISGTYQFCDLFADNRDDFYIGSTSAFPCGNPSDASTPRNAAFTLENPYGSATNGRAVCVNITMAAGYAYPLGNVYGQKGLPAENQFKVSGPGLGTNVTDLTGFISSDSCS
ncbi:unnamed protein product [Aureobasidium vineae]|uniref:PA14 domain-containing protein n=1 Tax=Aureobasidium vineae TaxID=2773715 RepID=A0A9N8JB04_9PEZI|nr:unnamed protein product [Aureobasidium vineae]